MKFLIQHGVTYSSIKDITLFWLKSKYLLHFNGKCILWKHRSAIADSFDQRNPNKSQRKSHVPLISLPECLEKLWTWHNCTCYLLVQWTFWSTFNTGVVICYHWDLARKINSNCYWMPTNAHVIYLEMPFGLSHQSYLVAKSVTNHSCHYKTPLVTECI